MDATTMLSTASLIQKLKSDYPGLIIERGDDFHWSFEKSTITYSDSDPSSLPAHLLHELSHAVLEHKDYTRDIELLGFERDAWAYAQKTLSPKYGHLIADEIIKVSLDSYRDWLHARSTCPACSATGVEIKKTIYGCPVCGGQWRVNEARLCGLRRHAI